MKNVTITLPEDTAQWARVWAAKKGMSVSAAFAQLLEEQKTSRDDARRAWADFSAVKSRDLSKGAAYPSRSEIHER